MSNVLASKDSDGSLRAVVDLFLELVKVGAPSLTLAVILFVAAGTFEILGMASLLPVAVSLLQGGSVEGVYLFSLIGKFGFSTSSLNLHYFLIIVVVAMITRGIMLLIAYSLVGIVSAQVEFLKSQELLANLLRSKWQYLMKMGTGNAVDAVTRQIAEAGTATVAFGGLVSNAILALTLAAVAIIVSPGTVFAAALVAIPLFAVMRLLNTRTYAISQQISPLYQDRNRQVIELIHQAKYIKAANLQSVVLDAIRKCLERIKTKNTKIRFYYGLGATLPDTLIVCSICAVIALIAGAATDRSQYIALSVLLLYRAFQYSNAFQLSRQIVMHGLPAFSEVNAVSKLSRREQELPLNSRKINFERTLEFRDVSFKYGEMEVLKNFSLLINKSEIVVLKGPSGAGKSTLVDLMVGLLVPDSGQILVDGMALSPQFIESFRDKIAYIPQEPVVFDGTVRQNITVSVSDASEVEIWEALEIAQLADTIRDRPEGLNTPVGDRGLRLSGGQRQRLGLARAIIKKASIIILDEATSAIDGEREARVFQRLFELEKSVTFIIISHGAIHLDSSARVKVVDLGLLNRKGMP